MRLSFFSVGLLFLFLQCAVAKDYYIRTQAYGANTGTSWNDAWGPDRIDDAVKNANASGTVYIRADEGNFTASTTNLYYGGGQAGARVRIRGVDVNLNPRLATFVGSRKSFVAPLDPETPTNASTFGGGTFFEIRGRSLEIAWLRFVNIGYVIAFGTNNVSDVLIENCDVYNVRSFVDGDATVWNVTIRNITGFGYSKKFIRFQAYSHDILVENVVADSARQAYDNFAGGFVLDENAYDITVRGCWFLNGYDNQNNDTSKYWNSDGYSSERGNHDILIENSKASGWTDGGHDHKAENITLRGCSAWDNKRNYRLWGYTTMLYDCISSQPHVRGGSGGQSHIYLNDNALATVIGGKFSHNDSKTRAYYLETASILTLIGVNEIFTGNASIGGNNYIVGGAKIVRLNATTSTIPSRSLQSTTSGSRTTRSLASSSTGPRTSNSTGTPASSSTVPRTSNSTSRSASNPTLGLESDVINEVSSSSQCSITASVLLMLLTFL